MSATSFDNSSGVPISYLITPGLATKDNYLETKDSIIESAGFAVASNINFIQIREKLLPARHLAELADEIVRLCRNRTTRVLINERFDIAAAAGAAGVHLTSTSIPVENVRAVSRPDFLIGVSVHSAAEAYSAKDTRADYVMFGPVFETPSKRVYGKPLGLEALRGVCADLQGFPVIAVGGINAGRIDKITEAGAAGFAAIRYFVERQSAL